MHLVRTSILLAITALALAACSPAAPVVGVNDPYESTNRKIHAFNKGLDRAALRPVSRAYGAVLPEPVRRSVRDFSENLGTPGNVVNNVLQGDLKSAGSNTLRFAINTTAGIGGLFDAATVMGMPPASGDFGQTLSVWGVSEGAYLELPLLGPSTSRDAVGEVVDIFLDPLGYVTPAPKPALRRGAQVADIIDTRHRLGSNADALLYESADSYAALRLTYLQNRRFELGQTSPTADVAPGAQGTDPYIDPYVDPYIDPYEE